VSIEFFFRLCGMLVLGAGGFYVGQQLLRAGGVSVQDGLPTIIVSILLGGLIGFVTAPFVTTRPYRVAQQKIKQTPATDLAAAVAGLVLGLLIAVLFSFPLSLLPSPLREVLPVIAAVVFGLLGMTTMMSRRRDFAQLASGRLALRSTEAGAPMLEERSVLLDTSVIIDGRIADISRTGFLTGVLLVPRFAATGAAGDWIFSIGCRKTSRARCASPIWT
jgi:uncharacterized protein YacL